MVSKDLGALNEKYNLCLDNDFNSCSTVTHAIPTEDGITRYYVLLTPKAEPDHVAHESKHIVNRVFRDRGINLDLINDEPECYLLGWVFEKIYKTLKKWKK